MDEIQAARQEINNFIKSNKKFTVIDYKANALNARRFWHKIASRNMLKFLFQSFVIMNNYGIARISAEKHAAAFNWNEYWKRCIHSSWSHI
jgi:hypothetical protein